MRKKIIKSINFLQLLKQRGEIRINKKKYQAFEKIYLSGEAYVFEMLVNLKLKKTLQFLSEFKCWLSKTRRTVVQKFMI